MAKVQTAIRIDQELLDAFDKLAEQTGETRTDVMVAALERGLYEEQRFVDVAKIPGIVTLVDRLIESGLGGSVAKLLGEEIDPRKVRISKYVRAKRRGVRSSGKVKGAES